MKKAEKPDFENAAASWDEKPGRVEMSQKVAAVIREHAGLDRGMKVLDYGCATGLVAFLLHGDVGELVAADSASAMLKQVDAKMEEFGADNVSTLRLDLEKSRLPKERFDLVYCSMTLHHIEKYGEALGRMAQLLNSGGKLCIVDLEKEDGRFHRNAEYVPHKGFGKDEIEFAMHKAGLSGVEVKTAFSLNREIANGVMRDFPLFVAIGRKE